MRCRAAGRSDREDELLGLDVALAVPVAPAVVVLVLAVVVAVGAVGGAVPLPAVAAAGVLLVVVR